MKADANRKYTVQTHSDAEGERLNHMIQHMEFNKSFIYAAQRVDKDHRQELLDSFKERFLQYRSSWRNSPKYAIEQSLHHDSLQQSDLLPLCVDIETAAVCDLACQFCYRQWIATPDKLMHKDLYYAIVDQCAEMQVPSVKLNWRGEPLLHPLLPEFIDYAKKAGVLETIINTNAVSLDEAKSRALVKSGLDLIIYSFDGGTKETYEKMRVGRFRKNRFEQVYKNIRRFAEIRREMGSPFPRTKIQMILTENTFPEKDLFFEMFSDCVDDVSVKAYSERGGKLLDLDEDTQRILGDYLEDRGISKSAAHWRDLNGNLFISTGRLPCEQIYQRLMVAYDGRVNMCCYDWGSEYPIGYVSDRAIKNGDKDYEGVLKKARRGEKGFERLSQVKMPVRYMTPPEEIQTLKDIWHSDILNDVRRKHCEGRIEDIPICRRCLFKDTYRWVKVGSNDESRKS